MLTKLTWNAARQTARVLNTAPKAKRYVQNLGHIARAAYRAERQKRYPLLTD